MKQRLKEALGRAGIRVERMEPEERRLRKVYDANHAPTSEESSHLRSANPRLPELEATYALDQSPMSAKSLWSAEMVADDVDLHFFRGDNLYVWQ